MTEDVVYPNTIPSDIIDLLRGMMSRDPAHRFTMNKIKQHPWVGALPILPPPIKVTPADIENVFSKGAVVLVASAVARMATMASRRRASIARSSDDSGTLMSPGPNSRPLSARLSVSRVDDDVVTAPHMMQRSRSLNERDLRGNVLSNAYLSLAIGKMMRMAHDAN